MKPLFKGLDTETQLLVALGSAVASGCIPCLENITGMARAEGIDEKKMRAAAIIGQFVKDQPANNMKACADRLLGTHLQSAAVWRFWTWWPCKPCRRKLKMIYP